MNTASAPRATLRKFGITMGAALFVIAGIVFWKHRQPPLAFAGAAAFFMVAAYAAPGLLAPLYRLWMGLSFVLGWLNARLLLLALYYLVFMPAGLILRLLGRDPLDRRIRRDAASYWKKKERPAAGPAAYTKRF